MIEFDQSVWQQIVDLIGEENAIALCKRCGGERIYVPETATIGRLAFLPVPARAALSDMYGGSQLEVPLGPPGVCTKRKRIEELLDSGLSANEIARQVGCTRRWVIEIRARLKNREQADLFD